MAREISTPAVALALAGAVTVWAAVKGVGLASGFKAILSGHTLPGAPSVGGGIGDIAGDTIKSTAEGIVAANNAFSASALSYVGQGHVYKYGGGNPNGWDCSGFCNWVIGHDQHLPIPGYPNGFDGSSHGPVTGQWMIWSGCQTIARNQVQAGDLAVWPGHMGIAISNTQMVNCPGPNGTPAPVIGNIDGGASGPLVCRRLIVTNTDPRNVR